MSRFMLVCCVVVCVCGIAFGETRVRRPIERESFSEDGGYVGRVEPAEEGKNAELVVYKIDGDVRVRMWECELDYEARRLGIYVLDGGEYVVTNMMPSRDGIALALYNKEGLIKKYSIQDVQEYRQRMVKDKRRMSYVRISPGRWPEWPSMFLEYAGKNYFCVRHFAGNGWMALEVDNGGEAEITEEMKGLLNEKGREMALERIKEQGVEARGVSSPYYFLGELRDERDRVFFEEMLKDDRFNNIPYFFALQGRKSEIGDKGEMPKRQLQHAAFYFQYRLLADRVLSAWDGYEERRRLTRVRHPLNYLGIIEGKVGLPETEKPGAGTVLIYVFKAGVAEDEWLEAEAVHRFCVPLSHEFLAGKFNEEHTKELPFLIKGVEPGEYWVKAVLDKDPGKGHTKEYEGEYVRKAGDYESVKGAGITVKCGEIAEIVVDCRSEVWK